MSQTCKNDPGPPLSRLTESTFDILLKAVFQAQSDLYKSFFEAWLPIIQTSVYDFEKSPKVS